MRINNENAARATARVARTIDELHKASAVLYGRPWRSPWFPRLGFAIAYDTVKVLTAPSFASLQFDCKHQ